MNPGFDLTIGNAHRIKNVPGRKTDVRDAEWIARLLRHGLIGKSFVPPPAVRDLRELVRFRRALVEARTAERNRLLGLLEGAGVKLAGVASDVFGVSGTAMLKALAEGAAEPAAMADLARGRMRRKLEALAAALDGQVREHHRFLIACGSGAWKRSRATSASSTPGSRRSSSRSAPGTGS